jgi:ribosomal protein L10
MSKKIKELELTALRNTFKGVKDYVFLEPVKVDSGTEHEFRKKLRGAKISVKLVKNTFAKKILAENGVTIDSVWNGPTLLCWGGDSIKGLATSVDGAVKDAKKDPKAPDKFKVKGGVADGQVTQFDVMKVMPTRLEAIGDVLGALLGPGSSIASALTGPATQLAGILKAIEEKPAATPAA